MTVAPIYAGIDVGKHSCVYAIDGHSRTQSFRNDAEGIAGITAWLAALGPGLRVGLEATGGYEAPLWEALHRAGLWVRQVPPARVHAFARAAGRLAKTDRIDAATIAAFIGRHPEAGRRLPADNVRRIGALICKRRQLVAMRKALLCQQDQAQLQAGDPLVRELGAAHLALIDQQIAALAARIAQLVAEDRDLTRRAALLCSLPGISDTTAALLLADMPELGALPSGAAAALAGLAPVSRDSGTRSGKRFIRGGRGALRAGLYMPALAAARFNPDLKRFAARLKAAGKPGKQVITAVARKLIELANTILKRGSAWLPRPA